MKKLLPALLLAFLAASAHAAEIHLSVAISMKDALTDIAKQYQTDTNETVTLTFGSSGQLETQIKNGAPIDAFISASPDQIDDLEKSHLTLEKSRRTIAGNTLVLVVPANAASIPADIPALADPKFKKIAIGDPKTVPAGEYATQTLDTLKVTDKIKDRLILGANVRQVLTYVINNDVDAGFVYASDAKQAGDKVRIAATAADTSHSPIEYPAVILKSSTHQEDAKKFLEYLNSDPAKKILTNYGFAPIRTRSVSEGPQAATAPAESPPTTPPKGGTTYPPTPPKGGTTYPTTAPAK